jgi:predicted Ser/Thr protein kinase
VVGEVIGGRYELEELLGSGGMSSVYRARDTLLERDVALKVLHEHHHEDDEFVERFRREARAVARLSHPNIVTVIDRGDDQGRQFIVFEHVHGETLKDVVDRGRLDVQAALEVTIAVARGLAFAHAHGIVHRDVKPQNVLLNADGEAKVTDFGIARSLDVEGVTQSGTVLGTSNYIGPEQATGQSADVRTDVYSLGVVLFELLTGELPFEGDSFVAVAMQHVHESPPSLLERRSDVPARVAHAVDRALEKDPDDRFQSMDELIAELEACLEQRDGETTEDTLVAPVVPRRRPRRPAARRGRLPLVLVAAGTCRSGGTAIVPREQHAGNRDRATHWTTERYNTFAKPGVGLVLDAGEAVAISRLTVVTDTPGFTALIRSGDSPESARAVSRPRAVAGTTTFEVSSEPARYYVVWITNLGPNASVHVNDVRAR